MSEPVPEQETDEDQSYYLIAQVTVSEYMHVETGKLSFTAEHTDEVPMSSLLGMLRMGEYLLLDEMTPDDDDEDE